MAGSLPRVFIFVRDAISEHFSFRLKWSTNQTDAWEA
jgi:hypothetical protein